ncbi:DUF1360 domain-containing protein [Streptomyces salinarius]|uniref:DUF1360 domain-containing protein n=1 Tax=Streptomyces salinarius TaxID=2762598 RepID=UPI002852D6D3|nr:DUF1360 domain-containing protein [Streptomyces salinarius]
MVGLTNLAALAFASYRGTQLLVHDSIGDPIRDRVIAWHERRPDSSLRNALVTLIACTYCAGWWVSGAVLAVYLLAADALNGTAPLVHLVEWFAVAGGQALLNRWDDTRDRSNA